MSNCSDYLLSQLAICRWEWYITSDRNGWQLRTRHAHPSGLLTDCPATDYGPLTLSELSDVLCIMIDELAQTQDDCWRF